MIVGIQIIAILFALVMAYLTFTHFKRKEFTVQESLVLGIFWAGFIFITVFPHSVDFLVHTFQLNRAMDLVMIVGFFILIAASFQNFTATERLSRKIEQIIRADALRDLEKQKK